MNNEIKKTSNEWVKETGYEIIDPDGWDRLSFEYSFYKEPITKTEFEKRLSYSTVRRKFKI